MMKAGKFLGTVALVAVLVGTGGGFAGAGRDAKACDLACALVLPQMPNTLWVEASGKAAQGTNKTASEAQAFVDRMGHRAIGFLSNADLTQTQKERQFRRLLKDSFDMNTIGRFAIGRYWNAATAEQRKNYQKLFENMVVDVYAARFNEYQGQTFEVAGARTDGVKDTMVTSFILPDAGPKIQVDWRVRKKKSGYKIVDVIIEGVSMSVTQRSDFSSVIQRGGGDVGVLLAHLESQ